MPATATRKPRRIFPAVCEGACVVSKAIAPCEIFPKGIPGLALLNGKSYLLAYNATLPAEGPTVIHGYRLTSTETLQAYDIPADVSDCSCPDHVFRRGTPDFPCCKHQLAIRLFKEQGKLA